MSFELGVVQEVESGEIGPQKWNARTQSGAGSSNSAFGKVKCPTEHQLEETDKKALFFDMMIGKL